MNKINNRNLTSMNNENKFQFDKNYYDYSKERKMTLSNENRNKNLFYANNFRRDNKYRGNSYKKSINMYNYYKEI